MKYFKWEILGSKYLDTAQTPLTKTWPIAELKQVNIVYIEKLIHNIKGKIPMFTVQNTISQNMKIQFIKSVQVVIQASYILGF